MDILTKLHTARQAVDTLKLLEKEYLDKYAVAKRGDWVYLDYNLQEKYKVFSLELKYCKYRKIYEIVYHLQQISYSGKPFAAFDINEDQIYFISKADLELPMNCLNKFITQEYK